jgi:cyclopropane-fatty-acyl-phospholipid synthase
MPDTGLLGGDLANEKKAVEIAGEQIFKTYMKYLTSCANFFRSGEVNIYQFKLRKI